MNKNLNDIEKVGAPFDTSIMGQLRKEATESLVVFCDAPAHREGGIVSLFFPKVDCAHVVMLAQKDILPTLRMAEVFGELKKFKQLGVDSLVIDARRGALLFQIDQFLQSVVGHDLGMTNKQERCV